MYGLMLNVPSCSELAKKGGKHTMHKTPACSTCLESGMTRQDEPESKSAGKKPPFAADMLGLDQRKSWVEPKRTP